MNWPSIIYPLHQCVWPECWELFMISHMKGDYGLVTLWSFRPNFLKIIKNLLISLEVKTQEHQGPNHSSARNSKAKPGLESFSTVSSLHHPFFFCDTKLFWQKARFASFHRPIAYFFWEEILHMTVVTVVVEFQFCTQGFRSVKDFGRRWGCPEMWWETDVNWK